MGTSLSMCFNFNPLIPRSDRYINSPYIFNSVKQTGNDNEENYQLGDMVLIQHQILMTSRQRNV